MAWPSIALLLAVALGSAEALRLGKPAPSTGLSSSTSQRFPEDLLAHPAFKVHFDDRATVSNSTASALLAKSRAAQHGGAEEEVDDWSPRAQHHVLIHSTPRQAHLCSLTPSSASTSSSPSSVSIESSLTPSNVVAARHRVIISGLSLLAPLKGTCLYHTLDWFTYSLCFGEAVRQFKAIEATVGVGRIPAQDPSKDAYVLGRWRKDLEIVGGRMWNESDARALPHKDSSTSSDADALDDDDNGTDLMQTIRFTTLGTEQRYLSQLWTDGTRCDINDEPRSVEVQYHCNPTLSGAGASRIALIKETTTCSYVMVVETGLTCREKELRVGREGRGREEGVGEWRCVRVVEGEEVKGVKGLEGEARPKEAENKVKEEEKETPAPARDEADYLHTKSTSPWLPSTENPTAISSDTFYAVSWDEDGHLVVDSIGSFAADWLQVEEEEQLLREQQGEGGGNVDPEDAAQRHLQARAAAGQKLRELVGGGEGGEGAAAGGAAAPERSLEEILSEVLFSGQAGNDGGRGDGNGVRVHILDGAEDGEPLAGIAGLRRQRRRGDGEEDGEPVEIDATDLQASLARAIEEELNRLRAKGRAKEQQQQSNTAPPETTQGAKDTAESQQRKARLDRLAAALVESMQDGDQQGDSAGQGQHDEEAAPQNGGNARIFDELNGAARAQAWTPKPFAPGQEGAVRRETLAEKAERVYRDRERDRDDGKEREQGEKAAARGGTGGHHDEL